MCTLKLKINTADKFKSTSTDVIKLIYSVFFVQNTFQLDS